MKKILLLLLTPSITFALDTSLEYDYQYSNNGYSNQRTFGQANFNDAFVKFERDMVVNNGESFYVENALVAKKQKWDDVSINFGVGGYASNLWSAKFNYLLDVTSSIAQIPGLTINFNATRNLVTSSTIGETRYVIPHNNIYSDDQGLTATYKAADYWTTSLNVIHKVYQDGANRDQALWTNILKVNDTYSFIHNSLYYVTQQPNDLVSGDSHKLLLNADYQILNDYTLSVQAGPALIVSNGTRAYAYSYQAKFGTNASKKYQVAAIYGCQASILGFEWCQAGITTNIPFN